MIQFVTAPDEIKYKLPLKVFLAGGITNCPDWQAEIIERLFDDSERFNYLYNVIIFNPRRQFFPIEIKEETERQITWEYNRLKESDIIAFWFARGSLNPIVLFEYGKFITNYNKKIVLGVDAEYERKSDVEIQTKLARPDIVISYNLKDFYYELLIEIKKLNK
jgi:hypothetical protein